jgi:cytochrome b561
MANAIAADLAMVDIMKIGSAFATLRSTHTVLPLILFATFLVHLAAAIVHGLIFRDEVFPSMSLWRFGSAAGSGVRPSFRRAGGQICREW